MITSTSNSTIKHISQLLKKRSLREKEGLFIMEGLRSVCEVPSVLLVKAYISESASLSEKYELVKNMDHEIVSDHVMASISETQTCQGFLAVVKQKPEKKISYKKDGLYLLLEHIQDPGNLGTMIRMSEACGVDCVVMSDDTVDIYNPKVVRSTMGAILRVPFLYVSDLCSTISDMKHLGISIYGASLKNSRDYADVSYREACGFVIGNEANGLTRQTEQVCSGCVHIPMRGNVESLNAAVAASVLTFEAYRQKRAK